MHFRWWGVCQQEEKMKDDYNVLFIFFEESYEGDGVDIDDLEVLENVTSEINKKDILVKRHPRNTVNRFEKLGYKTNINTTIPWELIILNNNFTNTLFLTIGSSAATNPYFIFGITAKVVFLCDCLREKKNLRTDILELTKGMCKKREDLFFFPKSIEEAKILLQTSK